MTNVSRIVAACVSSLGSGSHTWLHQGIHAFTYVALVSGRGGIAMSSIHPRSRRHLTEVIFAWLNAPFLTAWKVPLFKRARR